MLESYAQGRPLEYWLSADLARVSPPQAPSRLRQLADAQGALAAAWSCAIGGGPLMLLIGAVVSSLTGNPAWVLSLGLPGVLLGLLGWRGWKKVRLRLPDTNKLLINRGPGSAKGGVWATLGIAGLQAAAFAVAVPSALEQGTLPTLLWVYFMMVLLLVAVILVPSVVLGRARESFRERLLVDPALRRAVEEDMATWRDPHGGSTAYGPL
ncbi:hypothetical protein [Paenarthrobacter nitroguajacolicus]|uniref:hypothetical protein n=1 Tax=Paenarthrobacter nitroguajacolicus TaxID=211146 RepID=UPI002855798B|nr:hypothetical protein [Paenarthrobacter nitroguajacolicus]MDR6638802.1 hypothetical protein [Paenarthrobacter nitroguajacolicus]